HRGGKQGIGSAHKEGMRWAYAHGFELLLTMDCDFTHSPERIPDLLSHATDHEIVVGSRYMQPGSLSSWSMLRKMLTRVGHWLTTTFLGMPFDATGAFRLYNLVAIPPSTFDLVYSRSYSFFFESLYVLWLNGHTIKEVPLDLPARTYGHSKMVWRDALYSSSLLLYLYIKTKLDKDALLYTPPYEPDGAVRHAPRDIATGREWDAYWLAKDKPASLIYDLIAVFYRKFIIRRIVNHFIPKYFPPGGDVLHAGCGSGQVDTDIAQKMSLCALDISPQALAIYRKSQPQVTRLIHGSIFDIPVPDDTYDGIYNLGVMEHFTEEEIEEILKEFNRVLKPGGRITLFWPPAYGLSVRFLAVVHWVLRRSGNNRNLKLHPDEITHVRSRGQIKRYLDSAGFSLVTFYFGIRDLFTYTVIVAEKAAGQTSMESACAPEQLRIRAQSQAGA
ncbi:MAG TPA: methyltransferase domain-containing protein, partial [Candidatus Angelobacter sp.]|nr:methyltransferase domain-containing protein [Candidatus Angelobacter sp.]